ncbi:hypothetical protein [Leptospira stimsonii]|uniref:Uncharacterized protein n=1 Tax=Leptospira stimsonii TaxID=2202203 RepID=A0A396Z4Z4_9LEPT|nr:hypothetical protein [Leptospira stimsonii]RHX90541.1 hypothetical protein DLM75_08995 [Leptospira stimsonii]
MRFARFFSILMFATSFLLCEEQTEYKRTPEERRDLLLFVTITLAPWGQSVYRNPCKNSEYSQPIALNVPLNASGKLENYRFITGPNGFKYSLTVSSDYPNCGIGLSIYNCRDSFSNLFATNYNVVCDQGQFQNPISGGTQTCTISSFSNQLVIISFSPNSIDKPFQCNAISFEVLP